MPTGKVKWFNTQKRYGFIAPDDGDDDLFVHANAIAGGSIQENEHVNYDVGRGQKGLCAENVTVIT